MKDRPYKKGTRKKDILFNLNEYDRRLDAFAMSVCGDPEFSYCGGEYYLGDGESVDPRTYAIMRGIVEPPNDCECDSCKKCELYQEVGQERLNKMMMEER